MNSSPSEVRYSENILVKKLQGYFNLMKPRVMILVIFTAFVGMMLAPDTISPINYFYVLLSVSLGAGSSAAINMWFDEDIDKSMERTKTRPIPLGIISKAEALFFGIFTGIISLLIMYYVSNTLATSLLLFTILFYVFIYTFWLKRSTSLNIVIGGAAGAIPPIIGWVTVVPEINYLPIMMFMIIFFWTPPHFWALSVYRFNDYEKVKVPMLPNVKSIADTKNQIIYYTIILILLSYTPLYSNLIGYLYLIIVTVLNFILIRSAFKLKNTEEVKDIPNKEGLRFFALTIFYLFSLFSALLIDNLILL
ncbi:heme o synthase [Pelagibacteraceae bacterium]|nr:heme o synthase [Pelagibacteraceae bacterium]